MTAPEAPVNSTCFFLPLSRFIDKLIPEEKKKYIGLIERRFQNLDVDILKFGERVKGAQ